jgi:hypothetical protein
MVPVDLFDNLLRGDGACGIGLHGIVDRYGLIAKPAFDDGIAFLESADARPDDLAGGGVRAQTDEAVDE